MSRAHGAAARPSRLETHEAWSRALGESVVYRLYRPRMPPAVPRGYPTLYLLHGRGDDLDAWGAVIHDLDDLIGSGLVPPLLAVLSDAPWSERASWYVDSGFTGQPPGRPVETALTRDLVEHVDATEPTSRRRADRVVAGYSMGGYGALRFALGQPARFGGALALSPAVYDPLPPEDSQTRRYGAFGRGERAFDDEVYRRLGCRRLLTGFPDHLPVRLHLAVGDQDWANPRAVDAVHDVDVETARVHSVARRVPAISSQLRVLGGGHDWDLWTRAFCGGLPWVLGGAVDASCQAGPGPRTAEAPDPSTSPPTPTSPSTSTQEEAE